MVTPSSPLRPSPSSTSRVIVEIPKAQNSSSPSLRSSKRRKLIDNEALDSDSSMKNPFLNHSETSDGGMANAQNGKKNVEDVMPKDNERVEYESGSESEEMQQPSEESESEAESEFESESDDDSLLEEANGKPKKMKKLSTTAKQKIAQLESRRKAKLEKAKKNPPKLPRSKFQGQAANFESLTPFQKAKDRLQVSAVPMYLPCRDEEFITIEAYLQDAIEEDIGCCIYIAGVPGTGKTATVNSVVSNLRRRNEEHGGPYNFRYLEINAVKITDPEDLYVVLWKFISNGQSATAKHALQLLDQHFRNHNSQKETCVVLVDELDQLVTKTKRKKQDIIYNLFDWPNQSNSKLVVLGIANTMDLPERHLSVKIRSRLGNNRIPFESYTSQELIEILKSRLEGFENDVMTPTAINLAAMRVAKVTGDARRVLDVCRRTVEKVERENEENGTNRHVSPDDISHSYNEMVRSGHSTILGAATLHEKIFLLSLARSIRASGIDHVTSSTIMRRHLKFCRQYQFDNPLPTLDNLFAILSRLASMRLIVAESAGLDKWMKISPALSESDLRQVLEEDKDLSTYINSTVL